MTLQPKIFHRVLAGRIDGGGAKDAGRLLRSFLGMAQIKKKSILVLYFRSALPDKKKSRSRMRRRTECMHKPTTMKINQGFYLFSTEPLINASAFNLINVNMC